MAAKRTRVLLAKMGLDAHDTGIRVLAEALRDAGMEVVYLGPHNPAERVARAAVEEDVQVIGLGFHCFDHLVHTPLLMKGLRQQGASRKVLVVLGGVIPQEDYPRLQEIGVARVFGPGSLTHDIVDYIATNAPV
ncbi:MAG: cobalamin-dependent protein [Dehalococcoidia bacterium]|jgi:methylmalonyl-CoA mutase C-terminal domain/subunit|nr:cobalamin-dependent protein [Dehalococcoidia bacterium]